MITSEQVANQRELYSKPIVIGDVAVKVLTIRNKHFGILDGVTIPEKTMIEIDPGYAFGDGTHCTTKMCVESIQKHLKSDQSVLDIGCGCGILSIVSLLLGADLARAVDIDQGAVKVAQKNAERNGVADRLTASTGNLTDGITGKYDLIVANILADPVKELLGKLNEHIHDKSVIIISGIKDTKADEVEEVALQHFTIAEKKVQDNWVCYVLRPKQ